MYDPVTNLSFSLKSKEATNPYWYHGEPIWNTLNRLNITSACYYWPGCGVPINNQYPTINKLPYDGDVKAEIILDTILNWRLLPTEVQPKISLAYLVEVDYNGHIYGPHSNETNDAIVHVDQQIDHGMTTIKNHIDIDQYIDVRLVHVGDVTPVLFLFPTQYMSKEEIYNSLHNKHPNLRVFYKEDIPKEFHFSSPLNQRISPVIAIADNGYLIVSSHLKPNNDIGTHGYNNFDEDMRSIFIGHGPNIKNTEIEHFSNIEFYNFFTTLLNINDTLRAPNNGTNYLKDQIYIE
eukprot:gene9742-11963_t